MRIETVYVRLLDEGTDVFRPAQAQLVEGGNYLLIAHSDYDPDDEHWEFLPGQIVRCEPMKLSDGLKLVAQQRVGAME